MIKKAKGIARRCGTDKVPALLAALLAAACWAWALSAIAALVRWTR